jgi:hypothetical protein
MAYCAACGKELTSPVFRTSDPKCYVFQGAPGDARNGLQLHTREGVRLGIGESAAIVALQGHQAWHERGWKPPEHENRTN